MHFGNVHTSYPRSSQRPTKKNPGNPRLQKSVHVIGGIRGLMLWFSVYSFWFLSLRESAKSADDLLWATDEACNSFFFALCALGLRSFIMGRFVLNRKMASVWQACHCGIMCADEMPVTDDGGKNRSHRI